MSEIRTSLEVGFAAEGLPERFVGYRGRLTRAIDAAPEFPFEDAQFDVVIMNGAAVSRQLVKEAHRVLKPDGRLFFSVPEKFGDNGGWTLPSINSIVREGYNITQVERPARWKFWIKDRAITICAQKKNWRPHTNTYRPYL